MEPKLLVLKKSAGYELLDSGDGEKLERFGTVVLSRPDPQALWQKSRPKADWDAASAEFTRTERLGSWKYKPGAIEKWTIPFGGLTMVVKPTAFKHTGLFPEQALNWDWSRKLILEAKAKDPKAEIEVLNLFGYTGGASLAAAEAGANVTHVDGSKSAITWARENADSSKLSDKPIRWILDDARAFVARELKRGRRYDGIIMDPPAFGHGPAKEVWKIEEHFTWLIEDCMKLLSDKPLFFLVNGYSAGYSSIAYANNLRQLSEKHGGTLETGELAIEESGTGRLLPCGIFARWNK
jgi:23S rRNA (cytosine1962-C5)-methyltransferase